MTKLNSKVISTRIYEELESMISILNDNKRNLAKRQRSIMINNRISALKQHLTTFYVTKEISSEERAELLTKVLDNYLNNQILNQLANKLLVDNYIWYDLTMVRNNTILTLMELWGEAGSLQLQGTANALASILMGIEYPNYQELLSGSFASRIFKEI